METDLEILTPIVRRFLAVEAVTALEGRGNYLARYRGRLLMDSSQAYEGLTQALKPHDITPLFRPDGDRDGVLLAQGTTRVEPSNPWINLVLFVLTFACVLFIGATVSNIYNQPESPAQLILGGLPFTAAILSILLAHEFGHYLAARFHKTAVTLPYFIPFPNILGTMGAYIRLKEPPRNKRVLLDIGLAGPLAGLVVAIPVLLIGLSLSKVEPLNVPAGAGLTLEGNSLLYLLAKYAVFGRLLPAPASYGDVPPLLYWMRYFFTSQPLPVGGMDVLVHPVAWAGWAGLLVTAINLIPAGQLDGGHLMYVLLGKRARYFWPFIMTALVGLGFVWSGWWLWALLVFLLGRVYAEPLDQITALDPPRRALAVLGLIVFVLVFTPVPLVQFQTFAGMLVR